jgi:hypothetical protein
MSNENGKETGEKRLGVARQNGRFTKGNPGGPGRGKIGGSRSDGLSVASQGMLEVMQHVASLPASRDTTYQHREYRKWLKADRKGFMNKLADLEKAALPAKRPEPDTTDEEVDEGTARVLEILTTPLVCPKCGEVIT